MKTNFLPQQVKAKLLSGSATVAAIVANATTMVCSEDLWSSQDVMKEKTITTLDKIFAPLIIILIAGAILFTILGFISSKNGPSYFKTAATFLALAIICGIGGSFVMGTFWSIFEVWTT